MNKRTICVVLTDRANFGRLWPVMREIQNSPELELKTICAGTMLLERFGQSENIVKDFGFSVDGRVYMELEGSVPSTMTKSIGFGIVEMSSEFQRLSPDIVLLIGDRYEALAAAIATAYQNITLAHVQGGEVSSSIDDSARHAITKFSHYHFPATQRAAEYIIKMGEDPKCVFNYGCPVGDYIVDLDSDLEEHGVPGAGVGADVNTDDPFFLVIYHPITSEFGNEAEQVKELLTALDELGHPTIWLWPNIDAGADHISQELRRFREFHGDKWLHLIKNLEPMNFQRLLKKCVCAIGNSSSFVRDTTFTGTPVVLTGDRQLGREISDNLINVELERSMILKAVQKQLEHGRYAPSFLYGNGGTSRKIVQKLSEVKLYSQKHLHYIYE